MFNQIVKHMDSLELLDYVLENEPVLADAISGMSDFEAEKFLRTKGEGVLQQETAARSLCSLDKMMIRSAAVGARQLGLV